MSPLFFLVFFINIKKLVFFSIFLDFAIKHIFELYHSRCKHVRDRSPVATDQVVKTGSDSSSVKRSGIGVTVTGPVSQ